MKELFGKVLNKNVEIKFPSLEPEKIIGIIQN